MYAKAFLTTTKFVGKKNISEFWRREDVIQNLFFKLESADFWYISPFHCQQHQHDDRQKNAKPLQRPEEAS